MAPVSQSCVITAPEVTVGVGSVGRNPADGPPMFSMPMCPDIASHAATGITYDVSSRYRRAARMISARLRSRGTASLLKMSDTTSCMEWRLSKMIAASGNRVANAGATAAVIGIWYGSAVGAPSTICQNRATVARTPACFAATVLPTSSGS